MEKIEAEMTEEQKEEERQAQRRQLEEIFKLMENNKDEFGLSSVDEIQEQMKLYISTWVVDRLMFDRHSPTEAMYAECYLSVIVLTVVQSLVMQTVYTVGKFI